MIYAPDQQALRAADLCNKANENYWENASPDQILSALRDFCPKNIGLIRADLPTMVPRMISGCLKPDGFQGYYDADEIAADLSRLLQSQSFDIYKQKLSDIVRQLFLETIERRDKKALVRLKMQRRGAISSTQLQMTTEPPEDPNPIQQINRILRLTQKSSGWWQIVQYLFHTIRHPNTTEAATASKATVKIRTSPMAEEVSRNLKKIGGRELTDISIPDQGWTLISAKRTGFQEVGVLVNSSVREVRVDFARGTVLVLRHRAPS